MRSDAAGLSIMQRRNTEALLQHGEKEDPNRHKILITGDGSDRELSSLCTAPRVVLEQQGLWECITGGFCVRQEARCNGIANCQDGSDEAGCPKAAAYRSSLRHISLL